MCECFSTPDPVPGELADMSGRIWFHLHVHLVLAASLYDDHRHCDLPPSRELI